MYISDSLVDSQYLEPALIQASYISIDYNFPYFL